MSQLHTDARLHCPNCTSTCQLPADDSHVTCTACQWSFGLANHLCASCRTYHHVAETICQSCGLAINRTCRSCQTENWGGRFYCRECETSLELSHLFDNRHGRSTADRLNRQMSEAGQVKSIERAASERRMSVFTAADEARRSEIQRRLVVQRRAERRLLGLTGLAILLFLVALATYLLLQS